jgi:hypothetical protein
MGGPEQLVRPSRDVEETCVPGPCYRVVVLGCSRISVISSSRKLFATPNA